MKKIIAVNAGPRTKWDTDQLIRAAAKGAEAAGAEVEIIDLFKLERYTGCISCFGCKQEKTYGVCVCRDGLSDVLQKIRGRRTHHRITELSRQYDSQLPCAL